MNTSHNPIVNDSFGNCYELVLGYNPPSDGRRECHRFTDTVYAMQFVARLNVANQQWPALLGRWLSSTNEHENMAYRVAALVVRGVVNVFKIPRLDEATPIPIELGKALVFSPAVENTPTPFAAQKQQLSKRADAEALTESLTPTQLNQIQVDCGFISRTQASFSPPDEQLARSQLTDALVRGDIWAWKIDFRPHAPSSNAKSEVSSAANIPGNRKIPLAPEPASTTPTQAAAQPAPIETSIASKKTDPQNFADAKQQLAKRRVQIQNESKVPEKYTQEELVHIASLGEINEKYIVRIIETRHIKDGDGYLGTIENGAMKYWSTTFDQLEANDTDPRLICAATGKTYKPEEEYTLAIIDKQQVMDKDGSYAFVPTYKNMSNFTKQEIAGDLPHPELLEETLSQETSEKYFEAVRAMESVKEGGSIEGDIQKAYFRDNNISKHDQKLFKNRAKLQKETGADEHFLGNGLTKNMRDPDGGTNPYGVVETFSYDKNPQTFKQMQAGDNPAVTTIKLTPIQGLHA
ncbi:hypothetical protein [Teredinibacter turnerae]|uniref:hypothetical protein n=1 Tax=Teredinibacter turnerae TaxID=2426 RepID=UPI00037C541F|nr:hypothetical protein [Teredinibacter turnerae]